MNLGQTVFRLVDALVHLSRSAKTAIEFVSPRVIRADENLRIALLLVTDLRSPVATYIDERPHHLHPDPG